MKTAIMFSTGNILNHSVVNGVDFHKDGQCIAACSADKTLKLWDVRSHQLIQHYPAHSSSVTALSMHSVSVLCVAIVFELIKIV